MIDVIGAQNHVNFMGFIFIQKMRSFFLAFNFFISLKILESVA